MKEQIISSKTFELAKKKGYPFEFIEMDGVKEVPLNLPTQSLLQKWLRDIHNLFVWVFPENNGETFGWEINETFKDKYKELPEGEYGLMEYNYKTYEEALEEGLQKALKLIK